MLQILGASFHCATYTDRPWWRRRRRPGRAATGGPELRLPRLRAIAAGAAA